MGNIILQTEVILSRKNHDVKGIIPIIDWKTDSDTFLLNEKKEHIPIKIVTQQIHNSYLLQGKVLFRLDLLIQTEENLNFIAKRDEYRNDRVKQEHNDSYRIFFFENEYQLWTNIPFGWKYRLSPFAQNKETQFLRMDEYDWEYFFFSMYIIDDNFNILCVNDS